MTEMRRPPDQKALRLNGMTEEEWLAFLLDEGLEVLAAYRSIGDPKVRAMFIRLMREATQAGLNRDPSLN